MAELESEISFRLFRWNPRRGDAVPFITWLVLSGILQISRIAGPLAPFLLEWFSPLVDLGFLVVPLLWVRLVDKESLSFIGVSKRHLWWAIGLGIPLGFLAAWLVVSSSLVLGEIPFFPPVIETVSYFVGALYHVVAVEFFYRGWVASRLERSYGFVIALLGAGLLYAFSPLILWGTDPTVPSAFLSLGYYWRVVFPSSLFMGVLLSGIARLTRNLLAPFLIMLPQAILSDLLPGGAAHSIRNTASHLVGTLALTGIVVVAFWLTRKPATSSPTSQESQNPAEN